MGIKVSDLARLVGKDQPYVSHSMKLLKQYLKVREAVKQQDIYWEHALAILRLGQEKQLDLSWEVAKEGLTNGDEGF